MFWPTRMAVGGRLARSVASASCSGTPSASHLSAVRPVSGVRYDATGPSCRTSRWSLGAASPSTSAIEPTARSWCCTPDATHSTSIEKTGAPAGRETTTGGGASAGAAGAAACAGGAGGPLTETPSKAAVISAFRTDCAARFASFLRRFSSIILRTSSKAPSSAALTTTAGAAAGAGAGAAAAAVGGAVPGRTCEKRQASPFRQAPRAKKEQIGFAAVLTGFAAVPTGKTCEKRQASPLRQAPRAKKAQGGAVVMEDDRGARRRRAAAGGAAVCCWGGIRASSSSSSALRRSAAMESRTILSTSSLKESLYAVSRASSAATYSRLLAAVHSAPLTPRKQPAAPGPIIRLGAAAGREGGLLRARHSEAARQRARQCLLLHRRCRCRAAPGRAPRHCSGGAAALRGSDLRSDGERVDGLV
mmetsp:Transcript_49015/g.158817  ORF Transcript_49015/g.158817 Transcript_49015/m.158817 type:complete len:418 (+) Transcript_49015:602-1855(+)